MKPFSAVLSNPAHPEYGVATIPFPIPDEQYSLPFKNEFGIQTNHGVRKPVYYAFKELHEAGAERLEVTGEHPHVEVLALKDKNTVTLFVYNHNVNRRDVVTEDVVIEIGGASDKVCMALIDDDHCNPLRAWQEMGSPSYLTKESLAKIEAASLLEYVNVKTASDCEQKCINLQLKPEKIAGKDVQPSNHYTCRFCPSSLKYTDKSELDGLQVGK